MQALLGSGTGVSLLETERDRLQTALEHLESSNRELQEAIDTAGPDREYKTAIQENIVVIAKYRARMSALNEEIQRLRGACGRAATEEPEIRVPVEDEAGVGPGSRGMLNQGARQQQQQQQQRESQQEAHALNNSGAAAGGRSSHAQQARDDGQGDAIVAEGAQEGLHSTQQEQRIPQSGANGWAGQAPAARSGNAGQAADSSGVWL